jgi:outer membrane cobalamin receptor
MSVLTLTLNSIGGSAMNIMKTIMAVFILIVFVITSVEQVFSQDDLSSEIKDPELEQEFKWLKAETYVITASRIKENIKKTPASITVVTDKQIRQMGARNLMDVLKTVPGFSYSYRLDGHFEIDARGGSKPFSSQVLIMVNSHSVNDAWSGGATWVYDNVIVDNVKRIEFLRTPGSALWGANAVAVINIITKEAEDINGFELTAGAGTYDTYQYNLLFGKTYNDLEIVFNLNSFNTHGFEGFVEEDYMTFLDGFFGTNASFAPGHMNTDEEKYDASLTLKYKGLKFDGRYIDRDRDFHLSGFGFLAKKSPSSWRDYYLVLSFERNIWEGLDLFAKVYRNHNRISDYIETYTPGSFVPEPFQFAPEGAFGTRSPKSSRTGVEIQTTYKMSDSNTIVAGAAYEKMKVYSTDWNGNFLPIDGKDVILVPFGRYKWPSQDRNFKAIFIENIWDITDDLRFTASVRYDSYSDFGGETSPMAGLTWMFAEGYDLKLHYSNAFRAPSYFELYVLAPVNRELDSETINSYEISFGADVTSSLSSRITAFQIKYNDLIAPEVDTAIYVNYDQWDTEGVEVEAKYDFGKGSYLAANFTYQARDAKDNKGDEVDPWFTPKHKANIMTNIRLSRYLNFYADYHFEDGFERDSNDPFEYRRDMSGFGVVNTTLIAKKFLKGYEGFEFRGSVYNLLDKEYTYPWAFVVPNDLPRPGRNYFVEMKYIF